MDTALSEVLVFKLFRAEPTTGTVVTPAIVIALDIIKHHRSHYFPVGKVLTVGTFYFHHVNGAGLSDDDSDANVLCQFQGFIVTFWHMLLTRPLAG